MWSRSSEQIFRVDKWSVCRGYMRTSSATNAGADKDSEQRQRRAITAHAKRAGMVLVGEFNDPAVSGADPIETRPGFAALLDRIEGNGVRVVIVEDASRFARELMTQELGLVALIRRGVRVVTANGDDLTDTSDPSRVMMRQIAGSFHEYEKARLVAKLKAARRQEGRNRQVRRPAVLCGARPGACGRRQGVPCGTSPRFTPQARSRACRTGLHHAARARLFSVRRPVDVG
jgi:DNA invertase Pin-like site-specific DNA recombinase